MSCCDETTARVPDTDMSRRSLFKGAAVIASVIPAARPARAQGKQIKLAYCSQLLCGPPYEVARSAGHFKNHGLDVQIVYARGGGAAMQALVGGAVDYAATALDVAIQAYANVSADIRRFAVTGRLPLFAVVTAPKTADQIRSIKDLERRTVGVSALGNADHALTLYLLKQAGADAGRVQFATMGVNLLEALRQGQIDVGLVQEPALTLLRRSGGRVLVNAMDLEDAKPRLLYAPGDGSLLTIWEQFDKSTALRYRPGADPAWTKEWELLSPGKVAPSFGCCNAVLGSRGIVYSTELYGFSLIIPRLSVWDSRADQWTTWDPKFKGGPIGMLPDGALYSMTGGERNQIFKVSSDRALTWESRSVGTNLLRQPQFRTNDEGYTIAVSPEFSWTLVRTTDGGRNWQAIATLPKSTEWFLVLPREVLIATEAGQMYSTADDGKNWRLERDANSAL